MESLGKCVLSAPKYFRVAIPFFLVQATVLVEVHPKEAVEHFPVVNLPLG